MPSPPLRHLVAAFLALSFLPAQAASQENYREWLGLCLGPDAGFQACANVSFWTRYDPVAEYTYATLQVANLQGSASYLPDSGPTSLFVFAVHGLEWERPSWAPNASRDINGAGAPATAVGDAEIVGYSPYTPFQHDSWPEDPMLERYRLREGDGGSLGTRLYGCGGAPYNVAGPPNYRLGAEYGAYTCNGAVRLDMRWAGRVTLADEAYANYSATSDGPDGLRYVADCRTSGGCITVTPEPGTWVMLATGLLGLTWFSRRRKRLPTA